MLVTKLAIAKLIWLGVRSIVDAVFIIESR